MTKEYELDEWCEICGDPATTAALDLWCYERDGWLCYKCCNRTFRCSEHDRDGIIRTRDSEVFDILCRHGDPAILVEEE